MKIKGYSLLELLIVLGVFFLAVTLVTPKIQEFTKVVAAIAGSTDFTSTDLVQILKP